ncbi:hypothetical protein TNCV_2199401 [Trichonephila clavipes]|nr:hypothetical protein TNCV_2199401 [Trichonephila clavipes]
MTRWKLLKKASFNKWEEKYGNGIKNNMFLQKRQVKVKTCSPWKCFGKTTMASPLDFIESDTESEYFPKTDKYDSDSDTDLSTCDEEDEEMKQN